MKVGEDRSRLKFWFEPLCCHCCWNGPGSRWVFFWWGWLVGALGVCWGSLGLFGCLSDGSSPKQRIAPSRWYWSKYLNRTFWRGRTLQPLPAPRSPQSQNPPTLTINRQVVHLYMTRQIHNPKRKSCFFEFRDSQPSSSCINPSTLPYQPQFHATYQTAYLSNAFHFATLSLPYTCFCNTHTHMKVFFFL